jgi:glutamyl/glutaminyl-tRNA synthetase
MYEPYIQSEKKQTYQKIAKKLVSEKKAYYCFCTPAELTECRNKALKNNLPPRYNRKCLNLSEHVINEKILKKIPYVIRLKMPDNEIIQ